MFRVEFCGAPVMLLVVLIIRFCEPDSLTDMVEEEGYAVELHHVTTEDGYVLGFHRMPARKSGGKTVFLMHGLLNSGADYLVFGPKYSLGYFLADAGYDVWLGNARGTQFSRRHKHLDPDTSDKFWDYSFHEIGKYDVPAMIDYALATTNRTALHYIGHSQGCTTFFIMLALRPEYNAKIASMHPMAAAVFLGDFSAINSFFIENYQAIQAIAETLNFYELSQANLRIKKTLLPTLQSICKEKTLLQIVCVNTVILFAGVKPPLLTIRNSYNFLRNTPAGASLKQVAHYAQFVLTDHFQHFDYEADRNQELYAQSTPPQYNLSTVTADIYPIYGALDDFTPATGMKKMIQRLGASVKDEYFIPGFNHIDFIYSRYARKLVHRIILKNIRNYKE